MKTNLIRMKTKASGSGSRVMGTRTLAMMLCFVMLLTAIGSGSVLSAIAETVQGKGAGVLADAAKTGAEAYAPGSGAPAAADVIDEDTPDELYFDDIEADAPIAKKADTELADTGADSDMAETGWTYNTTYFNLKYDNSWHGYNTSTGYADFTLNADKSVEYTIFVEGTEFKRNPSYDSASNGDTTNNFNARTSGWGGNSNFSTTLVAGQYVFHLGNYWDDGSTKDAIYYQLYRKKGMLDYGWGSGGWSNYEMTYTGDGVYKYTVTGNGQQMRFRTRFVDGSSETKYYPSSNDDIRDNTSYNGGYTASTGTSDNYWYVNTQSGATYDVWLKNGKVWMTISGEGTYYYLTGWLNGASETGTTHAFTNTSGNTWTYTFSPSNSEGGYQYMTVKDSSGNAYHPASHEAGSGTVGSTVNTSPGDDPKWKVAAVSGQTVNLTWDSSTHVLSWTVSGSGSGTSSSWKYTADHSDASPEFTNSAGNYRFVWSTNDNGPGKSGTTAIVPKKDSDHGYWADLTSYVQSNSQFYFALSNNSSNSGIRGNGDEQINDIKRSSGTTVTMTNGTDTIFYVEMKENSNVHGSAHFILIRGADFTKISAIGVVAYDNSGSYTDYRFYYKDKSGGGGEATVSKVNVYAKDGAAPINWDDKGSGGASNTSGTAYNYAAIATTTISKINGSAPASGVVTTENCGDSSSQYQKAEVELGKSIEITTTIASSNSWRTKYYVAGWCVNGVTYKCDGTSGTNAASDTNSSGVCKMTYTIPSKMSVNYLEITPIYYLRNNSGCITFALEGYNTVEEKWGNTPYIYPFYGNQNNVENSFGVYPGQPMVHVNGQYSTEIPLVDKPIIKTSQNIAIKGITINNGYADHVHRNLIYCWTAHDNDADHKQTYDYDDFAKIYNECLTNAAGESAGHPNSIIFRIQDETKTYNRYTYGGSKSGKRVLATKSTLTSADLSNIDSNNGWELLKNRYEEPIDIFGNKVTAPATDATAVDNNALRVISTGYNANIAGDYGTAWKVYKYNSSNFTLIQDTTTGRYGAPPSIFLLRGTASGYDAAVAAMNYPAAARSVDGAGYYTDDINQYEGIYKAAKAYANKPVYITYEKDTQDTRDNTSGTGAYRLDGRWYYTHSSDYVKSTVSIEYFNNSTGQWVAETPAASTGLGTSGNKVEFDSGYRKSNSEITTSSSELISGNKSWNFTATAGSGYIFDSWQIKYSDTSYDEMKDAGASASIKATANYTLVARFLPVVSGSLTITHQLSKSSTGEGTVGVSATVGSTTYNGTVDENGVARVYINSGISNSNASTNITVTLTTTPLYDGKVTNFGYDDFNTANSITPSIKNGSNAAATLPGGDNEVRKSVFSFTVGKLFAGSTLTTSSLAYSSTITETPHYYNFTYNFTDRSGASKAYTSKGMLDLKEYKDTDYITDASTHTMNAAFVRAKAPFESNFLKNNTLPASITPTYNSTNHTYSATVNFSQTDSLPVYDVTFKLPYNYETSAAAASGDTPAHKKYNATSAKEYVANKATFDLKAEYDRFVTVNATDSEPDYDQLNVSKIEDTADVNHAGNNFFTAPDELNNGSTKMYFMYWEIRKKTANASDQATAPMVTRIYYPDLHYRVYGDYYVEAKYTDEVSDYWKNTYIARSDDAACAIMYVGDSRNQYNTGNGSTSTGNATAAAADAADIIYNDFVLSFSDKGQEIRTLSDIEIGMVLERVVDNSSGTAKWAEGSASIDDMSYYQAQYGGESETTKKTAIQTWLNNNCTGTAPQGVQPKITLDKSYLNSKNYTEKSYSFYSAYGQKVDTTNNTIEFQTNSTVDNYVYRMYAYYKDADGNYVVSDPAYFCMRFTANISSYKE